MSSDAVFPPPGTMRDLEAGAMRMEPNAPQSTCASSAANVVSRRYTVAVAAGRIRRTARRSCTTEPG